ncbi:Flp pilus assembly complex ATPase component TadA [Candidatus Berkelbacteria bacterium]|nr:Flp pilus assembly complex ATPase component TadA [Candidatus Berkelbacteria bacterium]
MADDLKAIADAERAATQLGLPFVRLQADAPSADALALIPESLAREYRVIPVSLDRGARSVTVVVGDPSLLAKPAPSFLQELKQKHGLQLVLQLTPAPDFEAALAVYKTLDARRETKEGKTLPSTVSRLPSSDTKPPPSSTPEKVPASVHSVQIPSIDLATKTIPRETLERFPEDVARKFGMVVFALSADGKEASVAVVNPGDSRVREILKFVQERNGVRIRLFQTDKKSLESALAQYTQPQAANVKPTAQSTKPQTKTPSAPPPPRESPSATPEVIPSPTSPSIPPRADLKQASADKVRTAAKTSTSAPPPAPAQPSERPSSVPAAPPSATSLPKAAPPTVTPVAPSAAVPSSALGGVRPAANAGAYQQQALRNSPGLAGTPPVANVPVIDAADLTAPVVPIGGQVGGTAMPAPATVQPQMEERNLDTILGGQITDVNGLETAVKTGLIPKVVAAVVSYAVSLGASDVHVEAGKDGVRIRYRVDGKLQEIVKLPLTLLAPFVSRIKILAKLKIDESRVPQDGRFDVDAAGRQIDLRVSTLPTVYGEKVVLRLLDKAAGLKKLDELGITGTNLQRVRGVIDDPFGIILVTGPTGSGKTTTLYAMLSEVNTPDVNIVTLEDPVEYQLDGINQTQVKAKIGFGFADGLRSILRQDPNIIMVGEIRDKETAALATQAALTGHLVLATLHTNDAAGAIPRMLDMGVEPFLLASSVRAVIAQRLVRSLVPETRTALQVPAEELEAVKASLGAGKAPEVQEAAAKAMTFYGPTHDAPNGGYKGRVGIYEVLTVSDTIAQLTLQKAAASKIAEAALAEGTVTLRQDGILKALAGQTSLGEVLQATGE